MIFSDQLKTIFIHVHRTGGTAITNLFRQHGFDISEEFPQHSNVRTVDNSFWEKYHDYKILGFTRNPWARIFSWYTLIHQHIPLSIEAERKRFEEFIENDLTGDLDQQYFHYNSLDYFTRANGQQVVNKILRYERFENEVNALFREYNIRINKIPIINETGRKDYRLYYTPLSLSIITERCKKDIEYFKYSF